MIATAHTAIGSLIGYYSYQSSNYTNLPLDLAKTFSLGLASHYVADFIPHGHLFAYKDYSKKIAAVIIFDLILSIALFVSLVFLKHNLLTTIFVITGIAGSQLPDVVFGLKRTNILPKFSILKPEEKLHHLMHWHGDTLSALRFSIVDIWQIVLAIICLAIILK